MNIDPRRVDIVRQLLPELVNGGKDRFRPGTVASQLRERNDPIPVWELRGIFQILAEEGVIELDAPSGDWQLSSSAQNAAAG